MNGEVAIVGGGLTGLMCALHLAQRGVVVSVYEKKELGDIEAINGKPGRALTLDLSARGLYALQNVGLLDEVIAQSIPMKCRVIHDEAGDTTELPYGQYAHEEILTCARHRLFQILLQKCRSFPNISINFNHVFVDISIKARSVTMRNNARVNLTVHPQVIIGADGMYSSVRKTVEEETKTPFSVVDFPMSYKEISIDKNFSKGLLANAMHTWPRAGMMLVAQPNLDGSYTCALLMAKDGEGNTFSTINSSEKARALFEKYFSDASVRMPKLEQEFALNPVGNLRIVTGTRWTVDDFVLLIGDAAHGMVPFFGQGVNCSFEDCTFLMEKWEKSDGNWGKILRAFDNSRIENANAIATMSYENYPELFPNSDVQRMRLMKQIDAVISNNFRGVYRSFHNLVCFERIPYRLAQKVKEIQMKMLENLSRDISHISEIKIDNLDDAMARYRIEVASIMDKSNEN